MSGDAWDAPTRSAASVWGWRLLGLIAFGALAATVLGILHLARLPAPAPRYAAPIEATVYGTGPLGDPAPGGEDPFAGAGAPASVSGPTSRVDPAWASRVAGATGIPLRALVAYASADLIVDAEQPSCGIGWNTLAGIGAIESDHGRHAGAVLTEAGYPEPPIRGIPLDGNGTAVIRDSDGGAWDGDTVWDRAVGPMQFIPETWERWGADGNGDGSADPNQIDDAALAAARYLCASGPMGTPAGWRAAIFSYNHLDSYVNDVAAVANRYADAVG